MWPDTMWSFHSVNIWEVCISFYPDDRSVLECMERLDPRAKFFHISHVAARIAVDGANNEGRISMALKFCFGMEVCMIAVREVATV